MYQKRVLRDGQICGYVFLFPWLDLRRNFNGLLSLDDPYSPYLKRMEDGSIVRLKEDTVLPSRQELVGMIAHALNLDHMFKGRLMKDLERLCSLWGYDSSGIEELKTLAIRYSWWDSESTEGFHATYDLEKKGLDKQNPYTPERFFSA